MTSFRTFALVMALFTPTLVQGKCQKYLDLANTASGNLMDKYWNGKDFGSQAIWISGVQAFYLATLDQITGDNNWGNVITTVFDSNRNYLDTGKSYDDVQWVSIAYGRAGDVENQKKYYDIATEAVDSEYCGGGLFWNGNKDYKNAIVRDFTCIQHPPY
jgi:predicted alpha-1,6-mannanase (GH76 family)